VITQLWRKKAWDARGMHVRVHNNESCKLTRLRNYTIGTFLEEA